MEKRKFNSVKYALREIILVVIGILIAVSINNWNEKRKQKAELENILLTIKEDIKNDIVEIDRVLNAYEKIDTLFRQVLDTKCSRVDYEANPRMTYLLLGYPEISFNKRGIGLLKNFKSNSNILEEKLIEEVSEFYTKMMLEIKVDEEFRNTDARENYSYWKNNSDWWADYIDGKGISGFIDYALKSKDYQNRVATFYFLTYKVYLPEITKFKDQGLKIIAEIEGRE